MSIKRTLHVDTDVDSDVDTDVDSGGLAIDIRINVPTKLTLLALCLLASHTASLTPLSPSV